MQRIILLFSKKLIGCIYLFYGYGFDLSNPSVYVSGSIYTIIQQNLLGDADQGCLAAR